MCFFICDVVGLISDGTFIASLNVLPRNLVPAANILLKLVFGNTKCGGPQYQLKSGVCFHFPNILPKIIMLSPHT